MMHWMGLQFVLQPSKTTLEDNSTEGITTLETSLESVKYGLILVVLCAMTS